MQIHQLHVCQLVLIQMFYALLEHFCTGKTLKEKLLMGMFLQDFPQYFRLFMDSLFSLLLNSKENSFPVSASCSVMKECSCGS